MCVITDKNKTRILYRYLYAVFTRLLESVITYYSHVVEFNVNQCVYGLPTIFR